MTESTVWDAGLQPERTQLAWRRTALSVAVGSFLALRILPLSLGGAIWLIPGIIGVLAAAAIWVIGERRYRHFTRQLRDDGGDPIPAGGGGLAVLGGFVLLVALTALVTVVVRG